MSSGFKKHKRNIIAGRRMRKYVREEITKHGIRPSLSAKRSIRKGVNKEIL